MAFILADRVRETASAPGTSTVTLLGAVTGYQTFSAGIGANNTTYYVIADQSGTNWEVGLGTIGAGGTTLARTTVLSSSNSGSLVNFSSGTQDVFCDYPASKQVSSDYPNAIGVTTPAAGTFTTITGQTEVLKGTGTNLLKYSQALATAGVWYNSGATVTNNTTDVTDPLGGSTATKIVGGGSPGVVNYITLNPLVYTFSIYLRTLSGSASTRIITFLSASPYTAIGSNTVTVTSTWQRFTFTTSAPPSTAVYGFQLDSFGTNTIYAWGAQGEIGSTLNSYIATTSVEIYGTPTLSFSGVAGLGLQSDGSLYVSPAGTGALQAQATTSSTVGGNARGTQAVDWQMNRGSAGQIASATYSVVGGGGYNTANGTVSTVSGGYTNTATAYGSVVSGGQSNTSTSLWGTIVGGKTNSATGFFNFIGAGFTNSGTSASAVTTQSGTMNATTAVTLSGSNANIKVGQYITGTSIGDDTYVAAISGTSLTLSKNASGSSTSTLSFYTPHGVVVGGGNNQATGSYSFIGGGGDAGTAANRNVASGDFSVVVGGNKNTASGLSSFVGGGGVYLSTGALGSFPNTASNIASAVVGGLANTASGQFSFIGAGYGNLANSTYSSIVGGRQGTSRGINGNTVFPACDAPITSGTGLSQAALLILGTETTNATATVLRSDSTAAGTTNQVILPNNSAYYFRGEVVSGVTGGGNTKGWTIEGVIKRGANAGATTLVGSTVTSMYADVGAATWTIGLTADTTNGGLAVTFTGQASTTIRTVCSIRTTEMTY